MGRPVAEIELSGEERGELERWRRRRTGSAGLHFRAAIVLDCAEGYSGEEIAGTAPHAPADRHEVATAVRSGSIGGFIGCAAKRTKPFRWTKSADEIIESVNIVLK